MRNRIHWLSAALAAALWLLPAVAFAAQTGEIQGYIVDMEGLPVAGVDVTLTSPQLIGGEKKAVTGPEGDFRFSALEPGVYTVRLLHPKYLPFTESNIRVSIDAAVVRDYLLEPKTADAGGETQPKEVRVVASAPVIDTTSTSTGTTMSPDRTDYLPTSRDYQGMAFFAPGVVDGAGAPGNPSIHGGSPYGNQYLLDGMNITDPVTNTFSANFNFDAIAETQVLTSGFDAEYGYASGGIMNIVTKSGGDEFSLDGSVYWAPSQLQLLDPGEVNESSDIGVNLAVGGPILKKKLWFFLSGQYVDNTAQTQLETPVFVDPNGNVLVERIPARNYRGLYLMGKLKWQPFDWQRLTLVMQADPTWITNTQQSASVHPAAERIQNQGGIVMGLTSETTLTEDLFWKTQLNYGMSSLDIYPASNDFTTPGRENIGTGTSTINDTIDYENYRYRLHLNSSLTYFLDGFLGKHELKTGLEAQLTWQSLTETYPGGAIFYDNGIVRDGSTIDGVGDPYQVKRLVEPLDKFIWGNTVSLYVQDVWTPFPGLTIRPGVRFDSARAYNDPKDGGREIYNFNQLSPRFGVSWDPFGDNKTVLRAGYYQYAEMGMLFLAESIGRSTTGDVYAYNDATGQYDQFVRREGGENSIIFKEGMKPPTTHEIVLGVEREIFENAAIGVHGIFRRLNNMYEDDEINVQWNKEGTDAVGFKNGKPEYIFSLGTPDEAFRQYAGVELKFDKRFSDNWQMLATYTLSRLTGTTDTFFTYAFDNPRQRPYEYGLLEDDVTHSARVSATYALPFGVSIGGTAIYASGRPYDKLYLNNYYVDYLDRRAPRGCDPDQDWTSVDDCKQLRLPDTMYLNARIVWSLKELTTQNIWLMADVFNVFNTRPTTSVEERNIGENGADFGKPRGRGSPLNAQLALRYQF